jgi:hypothetical protein
MDIQRTQIWVLEELPHKVSRAGAFGADPNRLSAQIAKGVEDVACSAEKQQGLRVRQPTQQLETSISRHGCTVLDKRELLGAASPIIGQAADVLD